MAHGPLLELPVPDDDGRFPADQGPEPPAAEADIAQQRGQSQQRQDGNYSVDQRRVEVLHGHRRQVRQQHGQHQLNGLQLADLALAGQAQPRDQQQIQDDGAEKSSGHEHSPFYGQYAPMGESYTEAVENSEIFRHRKGR